jgi:hypothetical protein
MPDITDFQDKVNTHLDTLSGDSGGGDKKKGIIPRPKPDDKKSVQEYRNQLHKKYPGMKDREDLPEYLNTTYETEKSTVKELVDKSGRQSGIRPSLFYASAMEEGMRGLFPTEKNKGQIDYSGHDKYPISGHQNFGLDRFGENYKELEKKGYLPKDFDKNFEKAPDVNEKKEKVVSANFKDLGSALQAKAAVLRGTEDELNEYTKKEKIDLSQKQKEFFTMVSYNAGSTNAQKMIQSYKDKGFLENDKFLEKQPDESWTGPYTNAKKRIDASKALESEGYF